MALLRKPFLRMLRRQPKIPESARHQHPEIPQSATHQQPSFVRNLGKVSCTYQDSGIYGTFINTCRLAAWRTAIERFSLDTRRVVDVGCSYGSWFQNWKALGFERIVGAEPNPIAHEAASRLYDETYCVFGSGLRQHLAHEKTVAANGVIVHILEPEHTIEFLRDVSGIVDPDGYFLYSVVNGEFYISTGRREYVGENSCVRMLDTHREYAREAGLTIRAEIGTFIEPWALRDLEFLATWSDARNTTEFYRPFIELGEVLRGKSLVPFSEVLVVAQPAR